MTIRSCTLVMRNSLDVLDWSLVYSPVAMPSAAESDRACGGGLSKNTYGLLVSCNVLQARQL